MSEKVTALLAACEALIKFVDGELERCGDELTDEAFPYIQALRSAVSEAKGESS